MSNRGRGRFRGRGNRGLSGFDFLLWYLNTGFSELAGIWIDGETW